MYSNLGCKLLHSVVESEKQRHEKWGHHCIDITRNADKYFGYLCSCGMHLTAETYGEEL